MEDGSVAGFWTQADALLRKNLTYQKRNKSTNCGLILFPVLFIMIIYGIQKLPSLGAGDHELNTNGSDFRHPSCSRFTSLGQWMSCPIPSPPNWPPLLQVPKPEYRAIGKYPASDHFTDFPDSSCREKGDCAVVTLFTGNNQTFAQSLAGNMFNTHVLGSASVPGKNHLLDSAFNEQEHGSLYIIGGRCGSNSTVSVSVPLPQSSFRFTKDAECVRSINLWRNTSSDINDQFYRLGKRNANRKYNEILGAYDFLNSNANNFNVNVWYNATGKVSGADRSAGYRALRLSLAVNLVSNAYLSIFKGPGARVVLEFVKEMPKTSTVRIMLDSTSVLSILLFTWVVLQLFPVVLTSLVYEKQQKLRTMMKVHGLGDGPYWLISYMYFISISSVYMFVFALFGSIIGLNFFTMNAYSIQLVFYFLYLNLQISSAFLLSVFFSNVKTATAVGYLCVFGSGLLGEFLFKFFLQDSTFPKGWIIMMQLYPGFALYRGLYEFGQYASKGKIMNTNIGMKWVNLIDSENGMMNVMIIMLLEWFIVFFLAYYSDKICSPGSGKHPKYFFRNFCKHPSDQKPSLRELQAIVFADMKTDVIKEREKVQKFMLEPKTTLGILCSKLEKVYPGRDGYPEQSAVRGLSLSVPPGECLGMIGPNGAGKTSFISIMIGLTEPTSGTAYVDGLNIQTQTDQVYARIGVCPQHDLLWETLTGREHLLFYGRLKNLKGAALERAVEECLKSLKLFKGGFADKQTGKYSGGMKRMLSVAISLIGDPKIVYLDEPSTGLDPSSRNTLWNVVKRAKQDRAIILTTHSTEEAEYLCDRVAFYVNGAMLCIGNPIEIKSRVGKVRVLTVSTSIDHVHELENMVQRLSPNAERTYQLSGTQKYILPIEVRIEDVFSAVMDAKSRFPIHGWNVSDTTLADIFFKISTALKGSSLQN